MTESGGADPGGSGVERYSIRLLDRAGALERMLGVLRRRNVRIESLAAQRTAAGQLQVELRLHLDAQRRERVHAELKNLADVLAAAELGIAPAPEAPNRTAGDA